MSRKVLMFQKTEAYQQLRYCERTCSCCFIRSLGVKMKDVAMLAQPPPTQWAIE